MIAYPDLGWIALIVLATPFVAVAAAVTCDRLWTALTTRMHTRRLIRDVQLYVHRPMLRPLFDTHDQPRKETP